jgi:hypothetical protein
MHKVQRWCAIPILLCGLLTTAAHGNGINPPRPSGAKNVQATCIDRATGHTITIERARITIDEPSGSLELRVGQSTARTLQLSQVNRLQIASAKPASDGFAKAAIELNDPEYKGTGFVRLKANGLTVRVTGFTADRERVDIPFGACRVLTIQASTSSDAEATQPVSKPLTAN